MSNVFLSQTSLFRNIRPEEIDSMSRCLAMKRSRYRKDETVYHAGDKIGAIGVVLSGSVAIEHHDIWGNKTVMDALGPRAVFGEAYACLPDEPLMVDVRATSKTEILFVEIVRILSFCPCACAHHSALISNLLAIAARKNLTLSRKIFHTASKSIRGRLLAYLSHLVARDGSHEVTVPFDRQQLADYLGVDRSALSAEIGKMKREGLIDAKKNRFRVRTPEKESKTQSSESSNQVKSNNMLG